jgi:putative sigma-54 modulation protein
MQIIIKGKQMDVSPRLRQYIERKVQKLTRLAGEDARVEVTVSEEQTRSARDRYSVQLALTISGRPIRSEVSAVNANMALDMVLDKVTAQLGHQKGRQVSRRHHDLPLKILSLSRSGSLTAVEEETEYQTQAEFVEEAIQEERNEEIWSKVMEIRRIATRPMTDNEVIAQMEAHHLDFYPFFNKETGSVNVIYRLPEGGYGLLIPALEGATE